MRDHHDPRARQQRGSRVMYEVTGLDTAALENYHGLVDPCLLDEINLLGSKLRGVRIAHINATPAGGGVAELLQSLIPLYRDAGVDAHWLVLNGETPFFEVTKRLHNALQGARGSFTASDWETYHACNQANAADLSPDYDAIIVHDPQPAAIRHFVPQAAKRWIWRCHIDTSTSYKPAWDFLIDYTNTYDAAVFSMDTFVGPGLRCPRLDLMAPAINPFALKNAAMPLDEARRIVASFGVDLERPFISQVSRFDPWKDPLGVIECFKMLRQHHPHLQLVMLGNFAADDPEGSVMYERVLQAAEGVQDIHIITGLTDLVGPFQALSTVVLQKSTREGFGLTVTEAMWKGSTVVAGAVGGVRLQVVDKVSGFLIRSTRECAERVDYLLKHEAERKTMGQAGREHVRRNFLMPRLLRDELRLLHEVFDGRACPARGTMATRSLSNGTAVNGNGTYRDGMRNLDKVA
jgi:trehalose synthase